MYVSGRLVDMAQECCRSLMIALSLNLIVYFREPQMPSVMLFKYNNFSKQFNPATQHRNLNITAWSRWLLFVIKNFTLWIIKWVVWRRGGNGAGRSCSGGCFDVWLISTIHLSGGLQLLETTPLDATISLSSTRCSLIMVYNGQRVICLMLAH